MRIVLTQMAKGSSGGEIARSLDQEEQVADGVSTGPMTRS